MLFLFAELLDFRRHPNEADLTFFYCEIESMSRARLSPTSLLLYVGIRNLDECSSKAVKSTMQSGQTRCG